MKKQNFITSDYTYSFLQSFPFSCFPSGNSALFVKSFVDPSSCLLPALSLNIWKDSCYVHNYEILLWNKSKGNTSIKVDFFLKDNHSAIIKHESVNIIKKKLNYSFGNHLLNIYIIKTTVEKLIWTIGKKLCNKKILLTKSIATHIGKLHLPIMWQAGNI